MRLFISRRIALGLLLCVCALAACGPQDGSAPATTTNNRASTTNGNATAQTAKQPATQTTTAPETRRITVEETQAAIAAGKAVVVDVRDEAAYKASHIKGAKSIPLPRFEARASELAKDTLIITYCA